MAGLCITEPLSEHLGSCLLITSFAVAQASIKLDGCSSMSLPLPGSQQRSLINKVRATFVRI